MRRWWRVQPPHTWHGVDIEAGSAHHRGPGWCRRLPRLAAAPGAPRHVLQFDGAALRAGLQPGRNHLTARDDTGATDPITWVAVPPSTFPP